MIPGLSAVKRVAATPGTGSSGKVCQLLVAGEADLTAADYVAQGDSQTSRGATELAVRDPPPPPAPPPPLAQDAISEREYEGVLRLAKACPIRRVVERIVTFNRGGDATRCTVRPTRPPRRQLWIGVPVW